MRQWRPIKFRSSIYLLILGFAVVGAPRKPAQAEDVVSSDSTVLKWQLHDKTDQMTDKTTREAVSDASFDGGTALQAHATCDPVGMQFLFDTFQGRDPAPFTQTDNGIPMRVRIDNESVRTAEAQANYTNEAAVDFFDPATAQKLISSTYPGGQDPTDILAPVNRARTEMLMDAARKAAPGTLQQLAAAKSIRVELSLTNGRSYVVDLNPQDNALNSIVRQCMAGLHAGNSAVPAAPSHANQGQRVAPTAAEIGCKPGLRMVVNSSTMMAVLSNSFKRQYPDLPTPPYRMSPGIVVEVASKEESASFSAKYKIPHDRCIVTYNDLHAGKVTGTIDVKALTVAAQN